jgi:hypothetical protein
VGLVTDEFRDFARELLRQRNAEGLPVVAVGHPVGGIPREQAEALITDAVVEGVVQALTKGEVA